MNQGDYIDLVEELKKIKEAEQKNGYENQRIVYIPYPVYYPVPNYYPYNPYPTYPYRDYQIWC